MRQKRTAHLEHIEDELLALTSRVETGILDAARAAAHADPEDAASVRTRMGQIEARSAAVHEACVRAVALFQPVAVDLRWLATAIHLNRETAAIGALARCIAADTVSHHPSPIAREMRPVVEELAQATRAMVAESVDAFVRRDAADAEAVRAKDDWIDHVDRDAVDRTMEAMRSHPDRAGELLPMFVLVERLERAADHAVHIAEAVLYMTQGVIRRHDRPHPLAPHGGRGGARAPAAVATAAQAVPRPSGQCPPATPDGPRGEPRPPARDGARRDPPAP